MSSLHRYIREIHGYPRLSPDEERALGEEIRRGCRKSLNRLVESNLGFVVKLARPYRDLGVPLEDLLNEGNLGLIEAALRFDGKRGNKFCTYAAFWVRKRMLDTIHEYSVTVAVPGRERRRMRLRAREANGTTVAREGWPSTVFVADQASIPLTQRISLDHPRDDPGAGPITNLLVDRSREDPDNSLIQREAIDAIGDGLRRLPKVERFVVVHRYGLENKIRLSLHEIGDHLGVTREWVRQLEKRARARLQRYYRRRNTARARNDIPPQSMSI